MFSDPILSVKKILFCLIGVFLLLPPHDSSANKINDITKIPLHILNIQQERSSQNGVLVSRPRTLDVTISDMILLDNINTLEDYSLWLQNNVKYQKDAAKDYWQRPEETLKKKYGDCEDYAFLTSELMRMLGYKPRFFALSDRSGTAHAICAIQEKDYFIWFDNARIRKTKAIPAREFAQKITRQYNYSSVYELNMNTKKWHALYTKS